jgi:hypothetical protein
MRCTSCGLPLSPTHTPTNCPRCGTPTEAASRASQPQYQQAFWETSRVVDAAGTPPAQYQSAQNGQHSPGYFPPPQTGHNWSGEAYQPGYPPVPPPPIPSSNGFNITKFGFIIAGLCILIGSLILIFVYFSTTGLPGGSTGNSPASTSTSTSNTPRSTPTTASTATVIPTQTATTFPGQQYVNNARTSAAIDQNTLQPSQFTSTIKTGQNIYVTFQVHPKGHAGAVCIIWYLNSKLVTDFSLPVSATSKRSYAYAIYGRGGPAYVELYWASSTQCAGKVLAQHVNFTVTN